jgi:hypothetical protein
VNGFGNVTFTAYAANELAWALCAVAAVRPHYGPHWAELHITPS